MSTLTNITGYLYTPQGEILTEGVLHITLQQDIVSVDATKVAPFTISVDLSTTAGYVDVSLYATVGASPAGVAYKVQFDPDPTDTDRPMRNKDGYWVNYWAVPNTGSVSLGSFVTALRGQPSYSYMPLGGTLSSGSDTFTLGATTSGDKYIVAYGEGKIRYNTSTNKWQFADDGVTFQDMLQGGGGAVGGDLSGTVGAASVIKIRGADVSSTAPSVTGQFLRWNNTLSKYEPSLDGSQFTGLNASNVTTGTLPLARLSNIADAQISATAAIAWSKISKTGSTLADLATRSAGDLNSGTLPAARLPIATTSVVGGVKVDGTTITVTGAGLISSVGGSPSGAAGGDLSGTYPNPTVAMVIGSAVAATAPSNGQFWRWNSTTSRFEPTTDGSLLTGLSGAQLTTGTIPLARISGLTDAQIDAAAAIAATKIADGSITNTKYQFLKALNGMRHICPLGGSRTVGLVDNTAADATDYIDIELDGTNLAGVTVKARVHVRVADSSISVTPKVRNITDSTDAGTGVACSATNADYSGSNQKQSITLTLASGIKTYRLMLTPSANTYQCYGIGYIELYA